MGEQLRTTSSLKLPPYSVEAEVSVLGGMMVDNRMIDRVAERLTAEDFYRQEHQILFGVMVKMRERNRPVDFVTLSEVLKNLGKLEEVGGLAYLGTLANDTPGAANTLAYAEIVSERAVLRRVIIAGQDVAEMGYRPDGRTSAEIIDVAETRILGLRRSNDTGQLESLSQPELMDRVERRIQAQRDNPGQFAGLQTGIIEFDKLTTGLHGGDLVIVAGRPSMGKTSFAMSIAEHVALYDRKGVGVFSMEMPAEQLQLRLLASFARIQLSRLRTADFEEQHWDRLVSQGSVLREAQLYIDETGGLTPMQLRAKARRWKQRYDVKLLVVDYLQLMQVHGAENREKEISEISRGLKALAKELGIPIIALSQLNRGVESRDNKRPRMSDLRESGALEQDADLVAFVYRDEVYNPESPDKGTAEIIIAKQRNGALGMVRTTFLGEYTRFENLAHDWERPPPASKKKPAGFAPAQPAATQAPLQYRDD